jgi:hypothetical protein
MVQGIVLGRSGGMRNTGRFLVDDILGVLRAGDPALLSHIDIEYESPSLLRKSSSSSLLSQSCLSLFTQDSILLFAFVSK